MIEQLTDEERLAIEQLYRYEGPKALRIIDAHAADRAALVAQRDNFERQAWDLNSRLLQTEDAVSELTRERDEARCRAEVLRRTSMIGALESEVNRLTEALAAADCQLLELLDQRDGARADASQWWNRGTAAEARVRELTQALAAAERKAASWERGHDHAWELKVAAETRVRELEARDQGASEPPRELSPRELREMYDMVLKDAEKAEARVRELEAYLVASDGARSRTEALAAEWQQTARDAQADLAVLRTEHDKLKARVERALIVREQRGALSEGSVIDHMTETLKGNQ